MPFIAPLLLCTFFVLCCSEVVDCYFRITLSPVDDNNVFSYLHITDTHISKNPTLMTAHNFRLFTNTILPGFKPELVVHTGDMTDGWLGDFASMGQASSSS